MDAAAGTKPVSPREGNWASHVYLVGRSPPAKMDSPVASDVCRSSSPEPKSDEAMDLSRACIERAQTRLQRGFEALER
jgi:hypothetical protein